MVSLPLLVALAAALAPPAAPPVWDRADLPRRFPRVKGERGLWIGTLHLCGAAVVDVARGEEEGEATMRLTLDPALQPRLRRETERMLKRQLTVRIDGVTVAAPFVWEPITGPGLIIAGLDEAGLEGVERTARAPC